MRHRISRRIPPLLLTSFMLFFAALPSLFSEETVRIGVYQNPPKIYMDKQDQISGLFGDIISYIADQEDWETVYVQGTWNELLEKLEAEEIDILPDTAYTENRAGRYEFSSVEVLNNWSHIYTNQEFRPRSILELEDKKVGVLSGSIQQKAFTELMESFGIELRFIAMNSYTELFEAAEERLIDAALVNRLYGREYYKEYNLFQTSIICCPVDIRFASYKNGPQHLLDTIDQYMLDMKDDEQSVYHQSLHRLLSGDGAWTLPFYWKIASASAAAATLVFLFIALYYRKKVSEKISAITWNAHHDTATKLLNLEAFFHDIRKLPSRGANKQQRVRKNKRSKEKASELSQEDIPALLLLIKIINTDDIIQTFGFEFLDSFHCAISSKTGEVLGHNNHIYILSNNRLVILMHEPEFLKKQKLVNILREPVKVHTIPMHLELSIGTLYVSLPHSNPLRLIQEAEMRSTPLSSYALDVELEEEKEKKTNTGVTPLSTDDYSENNFSNYSNYVQNTSIQAIKRNLTLLGEFTGALEDGSIYLMYQPKYELKTQSIIGLEALVRWRHPEFGDLSPEIFIPPVENSRLIHDLTEFIMKESIKQLVLWQKMEGLTVVPISINISHNNLYDTGLFRFLDTYIEEQGISKKLLELEITESAISDNIEYNFKLLSSLRKKGYSIAVDDFGIGYSSLSSLMNLPADVIKIDRSFLSSIHQNKKAQILLQSIISMSEQMGAKSLVEGVEDRETLNYLESIGCRFVQGYIFSPPLQIEDTEALLKGK
ncbi:MAG: EAL domain-containing protein [Spirochaetia bacterium]|nr:EAL domain-containing protein [Spirochaetia bacterium]